MTSAADSELMTRADSPYDDGPRVLPANTLEAIAEFRQSALFRRQLGDSFVEYLSTIKDFEVRRFLSKEVTDWEHREYFELR